MWFNLARLVRVPVLLPRLGHARGGDLGRDDHLLPDRTRSVVSLRRTAPELHRPFKLPGLPIIALLAFVFSAELLYWAKWPLTGEIILLVVVALPVYFYYQWKSGWHDFARQLAGAWWLIAYLPVIALVSCVGSKQFGGTRPDSVRLGSRCRRGDRRRVLFLGRQVGLAHAGGRGGARRDSAARFG